MSRGATSQGNRRTRRASARGKRGLGKALTPASHPASVLTQQDRDRIAEMYATASGGGDLPLSYRDRVLAAMTAAGVVAETADGVIQPVYDLAKGRLSEKAFYDAVSAAGLTEMAHAEWPYEGDLEDVGEVLFREGSSGVYRLDDGSIVQAGISWGWFHLCVAAPARALIADTHAAFAQKYPPLYRQQDDDQSVVPITFWMYDKQMGPRSRLRMIEAGSWEGVQGNYSAAVRDDLARLFSDEFELGRDGQLLLWQGTPGTGKTHALRALASAWRDRAEFHYITDPDAFFVDHPDYLVDVLLSETYSELVEIDGDAEVVASNREGGKWRVLILEDTGELLSATAKEKYGQGLSRFLNVVDGMVGQGLKVLCLVTTNDELGDLHPAAVRPGRCASQIEFGPLPQDEANAWLVARFADVENVENIAQVGGPATIAELYALVGGAEDAFAAADACADCGHPRDLHVAADGSCTYEDDAGMCACEQFADAPDGEASVAPRDALAVAVIPEVGEELAESFGRAFDLAAHLDPEVRRSFEDGFRRLTLRFLDAYQPTAALPAELQPRSEVPPRTDSPEPVPAAEAGGPLRRWQAVIAPEGRPTDDGRMFAPGSITWRDLPLTLMAMIETQPGHDGAQVSGRIDRIWREGSMLLAEGVFDEGEFGQEIARMVADGTLRGISVDLAIRQFEVGKITDYLDDDGNWISDGAAADSEPDLVDMLMGDEGDAVFVVTDAIIGAVTVCPFAAFADATISLTASGAVWTVVTQGRFEVTEEQREFAFGGLIASASRARLAPGEAIIPRPQAEALTAAAAGLAPVLPPAEWFRDPELSELTPLVVTAEGRVYGHAAAWDVCHIGIPGVCTTAPDSPSGYAYFHLKEVECDGGERVSCGTITLETGHADKRLGRAEAAAHYDDTGCAVADVIAGEDDFGIWVAGALRPSVEADKVRELRGAVLSGDWRNVNGELELVAILAVNVPGFPVPRPKVVVASGDDDLMHVMSLVAAGVHDGLHVASLLSQRDRERIAALAATAEGRFSDLAARAASA
jgi:hypothetical protein